MKDIKLTKEQAKEMDKAYQRNKEHIDTLNEAFAFKLGYMEALSITAVVQAKPEVCDHTLKLTYLGMGCVWKCTKCNYVVD
jgi:hypothetical protein